MPLSETTELNVVIVDDHVALRRGMELLLRRAGHHVVGTADDAEAGEALILRRKPDVALVDLALPGMSGAELTRSLLKEDPRVRIILYTGAADERQLLDALDAGAAGLALKSGDPEELEQAILTVAAGGDYLDPRLTPLLAKGGNGREKTLSPREREILGLLSKGLSGEEAATQLFLSPETVRTHVRNAMTKLGAATRAHAVALALQRGEISCRCASTGRCPVRSELPGTRRLFDRHMSDPIWLSLHRWVDKSSQTDQGKPVARRGRKARDLPRMAEAAQLPDPLPRRNASNG